MIDFKFDFKKHFMRIWLSLGSGMIFGLLFELLHSTWSEEAVNGILMGILIAAGAVGTWYILKNNKDFK